MHGQFRHSFDEQLVDRKWSYQWLKSGDIKGETQSTVVAAQAQAISTNYFKNIFLNKKLNLDATYRT
jgi:hypothetical protein